MKLVVSKITAFILTFKAIDNAQSISITPQGVYANNHSKAGVNITDPASNIALGDSALINNFGRNSVAIGDRALSHTISKLSVSFDGSIIQAIANTAIGSRAMYKNYAGRGNTAIGASSLANEIGTGGTYNHGQPWYHGNNNTAVGISALGADLYGDNNVAVGSNSLGSNIGNYSYPVFNDNTGTYDARILGGYNVGVGGSAGIGNTIRTYNTFIGNITGNAILTGSNNTFLGNAANATGDFSNATAIGANAQVTSSNKVRIGDINVTVIEGQVPWSNPSDRRLKENIVYTSRLGLDFINKLQPTSYNYIADKNKVRYDGLIAQDVEKVMQELGVPFSGLKKSDDGMYSLAYSDFVMPLINAVKEQQKQIQELKAKLAEKDDLKERVASLEILLKKIESNPLQSDSK